MCLAFGYLWVVISEDDFRKYFLSTAAVPVLKILVRHQKGQLYLPLIFFRDTDLFEEGFQEMEYDNF